MASCGLGTGAVCARDTLGKADKPDKATAKIEARII
jgi:hypothetical protein